jgi:hypothetical protein
MSDNILVLKRNGVVVEGYRTFVTPDEMQRRRIAEQNGTLPPVVQLKDRLKDPAAKEDPRQG